MTIVMVDTEVVPREASERDRDILYRRVLDFERRPGPRVGDYVRFADGVQSRIAHIWRDEGGNAESVQMSAGGSFYFGGWSPWRVSGDDPFLHNTGDAYCSFSGGLDPSFSATWLRETPKRRDGLVWFFHDDVPRAHSAVTARIELRVFTAAIERPR